MGWTHGQNKRWQITEKILDKEEGCRKRDIQQLRWEDCVKRYLRKAEAEEKCREQANNRDQSKTNHTSSRASE